MNVSDPGVLLREVARLYTRAQRVTADCCRTTNTQCHILTELGRTGAQPLVDLGARLCLEKSWTSRAVEALVEEGLVIKKANPSDARSWMVSLTTAGKRRVEQLNETLDAHATGLLASLTSAQRSQITNSLQLVLDALRVEAGLDRCCSPTETGTRVRACS
jgi:DNA-binding MarR family transcriptional regulator